MAIATAMKKVADSHKIPRTFLGYVINSTAAPVCIIIPISTWAVFYGGLFEEFGVTVNGTGTGAYLAAIPYLFFAWITLIILLLVIIGVIPMIGITRQHNKIAQETGVVCPIDVNLDGEEITAPDFHSIVDNGGTAKPWNFLVPLAVLVAVTILAGTNVLIGCMAGIATAAILMLAQKKIKPIELFDNAYQGVLSMVMICAIITVALTLVEINTATGMSDFVVATLTPYLNGALLPAIVFGFCAVYSYFGGGFWDMSMIFMPIVVPLATALGVNPLLPCAALVCAAAAGSTTYVCGDAIMITSRAIDIKPFYQMLGTLPYAAISYVLTIICFVTAGVVM
jgi:Na+/H+ antiporter NhaC